MNSSGEHMDNAQPMRMAGRFSGRVRGYARSTEFQSSTADVERQTRPGRRLSRHAHGQARPVSVPVGRAEVPLWDVHRARFRQPLVCGASGLDREGALQDDRPQPKNRGKMGLTSTPVCGKNRAHAGNSWEKPWENDLNFSHFLSVLEHLCAT